ncbi:hypothetical protein HHX48_05025 [Salinimonas sp. HHU 13199]|uniref:Uncharacterized protein n=1 Tax=Salinimonas profundi TaxID=2729140 RepID=A0ABR8LLX7_9ALTE|nr:hypothetical protein [Salinimonas profundi]MBD3585095.1 hypothetical protein [Salinimonas profundi]
MKNDNTLLIGQVLQLRDKLVAKRHAIPSSMLGEWSRLQQRTTAFDINRPFDMAIKGTRFTKPNVYGGSSGELSDLVNSLKEFNKRMMRSKTHH